MYTELRVSTVPDGMSEWLKRHLEGKYFIKHNRERIRRGGCCPQTRRMVSPTAWKEIGYKICFGSEDDALVFKLVWGEYVK